VSELNIVVCVKQVPATTEVRIDPVNNTLIRDGLESIINPYDTHALEEALRIKQAIGGTVTTLSMGIPNVQKMLKDTLALGADQAVLLTDRRFAGADTLATSYALAYGVRKIGNVDLIICGKQATDGDTAQVGPSIAEKLGIPHVTYVQKVEEIRPGYIRCNRVTDDGREIVELALPAVITVVKGINTPRLPSIKGIRKAIDAAVKVCNVDDVGVDESLVGIKGSATWVVKTFIPQYSTQCKMLEGSAKTQARALVGELLEQGGAL
jgi:electron transfer flavoprotein beta subunit